MALQLTLSIIFIISTTLIFPNEAKPKSEKVDIDVKVHINGKKVIDESHPESRDGKTTILIISIIA